MQTQHDDGVSVVRQASQAVIEIVAAHEKVRRTPPSLRATISTLTDDDLYREVWHSKLRLSDKVSLVFLHTERCANRAHADDDPDQLKAALKALFTGAVLMARLHTELPWRRLAAVRLAERVSQTVKTPAGLRREVSGRAAEFGDTGLRPDFHGLIGLSEDKLDSYLRLARNGASASPIQASAFPPPRTLLDGASSADLLLAALSNERGPTVSLPEYDMSETELKITSVSVQGFRGAPEALSVSLARHGTAGSWIVFGENGTGKSTIVDAIEFALQGRIWRSSNYDSPLAPALKSFAARRSPEAAVTLSDGTTVRRSVIANADGTFVAEPPDVRAGFRIAPIALRRVDILTFLDADALERGSVLLDYFPADTAAIGVRPDEEIYRLRLELTDLRIRRSAIVGDIVGIFPDEPEATFLTRDKTQKFLMDRVMGGLTPKAFAAYDGWSQLPDKMRETVAQLVYIQDRLTKVTRKIELGPQILNPIAYHSQIQIIRHITREVSAEVSDTFRSLCPDHPVGRIEVIVGESGPLSLDLVVALSDGTNCFPRQLFSEAYCDLLALLFFVGVAKKASERGQAHVLILDDVLQSIDATVRHEFVDHILRHYGDWQLIFTVHDRLWLQQLRDLFSARALAFVETRIESWSFNGGPSLSSPDVSVIDRDLRTALISAEPRTIAALAGQMLEVVCDQITRKLRVPVPRRDGDRYTLGDLWPPVAQRLASTTAAPVVTRIAADKGLRNLTAHADPLSLGLSSTDAVRFGRAVLDLFAALHCPQCGSWIRGDARASCSCGHLKL